MRTYVLKGNFSSDCKSNCVRIGLKTHSHMSTCNNSGGATRCLLKEALKGESKGEPRKTAHTEATAITPVRGEGGKVNELVSCMVIVV